MARQRGNVYSIRGSYRVKFPLGKNPATGKYDYIQETYPTEAAAWERLNRLRVEYVDGKIVAPSKLTVAQFAQQWLDAKRATVRGSTIRTYRSAITAITAHLGNVRLSKLDAPSILAWHAAELKTLHPTTVRHHHVTLASMLNDAVRWGIISRNVAKSVSPPAKVKPELRVWSRQQIETFLRFLAGRSDEAMWRLMLTTGIRVGELCALRWDDLFGDQLTIRSAQALDEHNQIVVTDPKSDASRRVLILSNATLASLAREREWQQAHRAEVGNWWNAEGWMFPTASGKMPQTTTVRAQFKRVCALANLPYIGPHGLRHTYGTDMMRAGVAPRVVQERMGHTDVTITLNLYSHPDSDMHRDAANVIERTSESRIVDDSLPNHDRFA